jgi:phosphoribosyl-ATP pyrophosphohydrolase/phosphoribosyl-AMP cyclohydrolase
MAVEELKDDCDGDAILLRVRPNGPACHTGSETCFAPWLWRRVAERAKERPEGSYVAKLLADGPKAAAQKVGEEGVEAALAGVGESDERLVEELADLWFHSYVLLAARGLDPAAVEDELRRRVR